MMRETLLSTVLIFSAMGCYGTDATAYGYVDCNNITETCKNLNWEQKGNGCDSLGSTNNGHTPEELAALTAAAQTCHAYLNDTTHPTTSNPTTACRLACRDKVWGPQYCKQDTACN
jgi:hypothetical protein